MRTIIYFVNKNNDKKIKLIGRNELSGVNEEMVLNDFIERFNLEKDSLLIDTSKWIEETRKKVTAMVTHMIEREIGKNETYFIP